MSQLKIREMPHDERPREKLLARGADALSNAELIAYSRTAADRAKLDPSKLAELQSSLKSRRRSGASRGISWKMLKDLATNVQKKFQTYPFAHPYYWGGFVYTGL